MNRATSSRRPANLYTECYGKPLSPYRLVTVTGVNGRLSGDYVIAGVTHTLDAGIVSSRTFAFCGMRESAGSQGPGGLLEKVF